MRSTEEECYLEIEYAALGNFITCETSGNPEHNCVESGNQLACLAYFDCLWDAEDQACLSATVGTIDSVTGPQFISGDECEM